MEKVFIKHLNWDCTGLVRRDVMGVTQPIRNVADIQRLKKYFLDRKEVRNYAMVTLALNTSLRIGDLLNLQWQDVFDFSEDRYKIHVMIREQKTNKRNLIPLNQEAQRALNLLKEEIKDDIEKKQYIFKSRCGDNQPIGRIQAFKIIKNAAQELHIDGLITCHSLRKTFGYQAWKKGVPPAVIMSIYNHSSMEITKRYLSIDQDDKDAVFLELNL